MKDTLAALWRDQTARHPEPPTPALIDATYESGDDALAWRLHWCAVHGAVPHMQVTRGCYVSHGPVYNWAWLWPRSLLYDALDRRLGHRNLWATTLRAAYRKLLVIPQEEFPC